MNWLRMYDVKQDEYLECSMKVNIDNFYAEFVIIENGEIVKFISNREFKYWIRKGAVMERLTERDPSWIDDELWERTCEPDCEEIDAVYRKLKEYEDLEEQGRLVKLPCNVGDTVWNNDCGRPCAYTITAFSFGECEEYICEPVTTKEVVFYYANSSGSITGSFAESEIGKTVFLTKSEAEQKLKEMENK